jgi:hypothetical protein
MIKSRKKMKPFKECAGFIIQILKIKEGIFDDKTATESAAKESLRNKKYE